MRYIDIPNWDKFQHRDSLRGREGVQPWIKVYTRLHHEDEWMRLSGHRRAVLLGLWIEYAHGRGKLAENTAELSRKLNLRVSTRDLEALSEAGFLEFLPAPCQTRGEERRVDEKRGDEKKVDETRSDEMRVDPTYDDVGF